MVDPNFQKWGVFHEHLSVDEMIVRYNRHHSIKQFIRSKPIRFEYKLWAMCGSYQYCYKFALYCGKEINKPQTLDSLGIPVVNNMLSIVENPTSRQIYFDNLFTSLPLSVD